MKDTTKGAAHLIESVYWTSGKANQQVGVRKELTTAAEFIWFFLLLRCPSNSKVFSNLAFAHTQSFIDQTRNIEQLTMAFSIRAIDISFSSTVSS